MRVSKLIVAAGVAAAGLVAFVGVADAAPPTTAAVVSCVNGDGVTGQISCDIPACTEGVLSTVTDQSGVQHLACVASAAAVPVAAAPPVAPVAPAAAAAPVRASLAPARTQTMSANAQASLPATGAGTGGLVIAAVLVGSGAVVSLLSRRKPDGRRKGFRQRRLNP